MAFFSSLAIHMRWPCSIQILYAFSNRFTALCFRLRRLSAGLLRRLACSGGWLRSAVLRACWVLAASVDPVWVLLLYFVSNSIMGFLLLRILAPKKRGEVALRDIDLFFTSVSAATVSSMSTVEMEALTRGQLLVVGLLMLAGGEVFTSMLHLHLTKAKLLRYAAADPSGSTTGRDKDGSFQFQIELGPMVPTVTPGPDVEAAADGMLAVDVVDSDWELKYKAVNLLVAVVLWYHVVFILLGFVFILLYLTLVSGGGSRNVLSKKGIRLVDFSVFLSVSSFTNCGFLPTNENMLPFRKDSGLLLLTIPLLLAGNTLFPACLRCALRILRRLLRGRAEVFDDLLSRSDGQELGFHHLLGKSRCVQLVLTAAAFLFVQSIAFCCMEWSSVAVTGGMSAHQKMAAALFQSVNSRHAGESVFDLSALSPAILVLFVVMMYLPPYTTFSPAGEEASISEAKHSVKSGEKKKNKSARFVGESLMLSQFSYVAIFVMLVCVTERRKLAEDPLNFNIFSVVVEVVSAYGNVGLSTGYSCGRQVKPDDGCRDGWSGFVGRWSGTGKIILIAVMFFGRLKRFNERGGRAWKLS